MFGDRQNPFKNGNVTGTLGCIGTMGTNHDARELQRAHHQGKEAYQRKLNQLGHKRTDSAIELLHSRGGRRVESAIVVGESHETEIEKPGIIKIPKTIFSNLDDDNY